jgi:hypothetical protein
MEAGVQPLDQLIVDAGLRNNDLVKISDNGLTHKQVSKARRGRKITRRMQLKVLSAWNSLIDHESVIDDLFNYVGK